MSSGEVGKSRSNRRRSAESPEVIPSLSQTSTLEIATNFLRVDARQLEKESDVVQIPEHTPRVVLHCLNLHRCEVLRARHRERPPSWSGHCTAPAKELVAGLAAHVHEVDPTQGGQPMEVVRVPGGHVKRLVPERLEKL